MVKRRLKYNLIKFLRLKGSPRRLALGFAVGACVNFYPTFGLGVPLAGLMAALFFANVPAGLVGDIVFKPLFPAFFYLNLVTGYFLWTQKCQQANRILPLILRPDLHTLGLAGKVFFTGALVNSFVMGTILYVTVYLIIKRYRLPLLKWLVTKGGRKANCV